MQRVLYRLRNSFWDFLFNGNSHFWVNDTYLFDTIRRCGKVTIDGFEIQELAENEESRKIECENSRRGVDSVQTVVSQSRSENESSSDGVNSSVQRSSFERRAKSEFGRELYRRASDAGLI